MKQPDHSAIGGARKTLPVRKARKVQKPGGKKPAARKRNSKNILDRDVEAELVRVFGEK
jgi:hypothetical protein